MTDLSDTATLNATMNVSITTSLPKEVFDFTIPGYLVAAVTLIFVTVAWVCNIIVLIAMRGTDEEKLKVKFLLKNAIAGDMMLSLSLGLRIVFELAGADESNLSLANMCANIARDFFSYFATFYQIFAAMAVAVDRFYSILRPLSYHTMKYSFVSKAAIFLVLFGSTFGISLPMVLLKLEPGDSLIVACYKAFERVGYTEEVLPFVIVGCVILTLLTYCSIFAMIVFHRRKRGAMSENQNENQTARKRQTSLALTFFLIQITYVLMYLPGALYFSVLAQSVMNQPYLNYYLGQSTIIIYLGNTIVDPLIYIFRIRSIRDHVPSWCCSKDKGKTYKPTVGKRQDGETTLTNVVPSNVVPSEADHNF